MSWWKCLPSADGEEKSPYKNSEAQHHNHKTHIWTPLCMVYPAGLHYVWFILLHRLTSFWL